MFFLKLIGKFIKLLGSSESPSQIAWGIALGCLLGLAPRFGLLSLVILLLALILRINLASVLLAWGLYKLAALSLDPLLHALGYFVLVRLAFLEPLWAWLYNAPLAPLFRLNNTVVMGGLLAGLVLMAPNVLLFRWVVMRYRDTWQAKVRRWRISQALAGSKLVQTAMKIKAWGDRS